MRGLYHELLPMRVRLSKTPQFLQEWWWHSARCALVGWVMSTSENPWAVGIPGLLNYWLGPPFSSPIIRWKMMKYAYLTKQTSNQSTTVFQSKVDVNLPLFYWPQRKKKCQSSENWGSLHCCCSCWLLTSLRWRLFNLPGTPIWKEALLALWAPWLISGFLKLHNTLAYGSSCLWFSQLHGVTGGEPRDEGPIYIYIYVYQLCWIWMNPSLTWNQSINSAMLDGLLFWCFNRRYQWYQAVPWPIPSIAFQVKQSPRWSWNVSWRIKRIWSAPLLRTCHCWPLFRCPDRSGSREVYLLEGHLSGLGASPCLYDAQFQKHQLLGFR